ncbi:MAG: GNAT family protein [Patescibacteria group bacterium]|nr:GNAT family N-acetyltransferase [Patescibacteria group bacterium]MBU1952603.1 GNAT family N-acetyltransferase [Patescibacteria group bacterium]
MFGNPIRVELDRFGVKLRPPKKSEMENLAELFSSMEVQRYTLGTYAVTSEKEQEWYDKVSKEQDSVLWAIVPDGTDSCIGITSLHAIHPLWGSCTSGIVIADRSYWGKGVAYRSHLARIWYAAKTLNRTSIQTSVRVPNEASLKALLKVGYRVSGKYERSVFREGSYLDTYLLSWLNPWKIKLLYPMGSPPELKESLKKARQALGLAEKSVKFL